MSTLDQIHESIDAHLAELRREIVALEAARAALRDESPSVTKSAASKPTAPTAPTAPATSTRRRRSSAKPASNGNAVTAATASDDAAESPPSVVSPAVVVSPVTPAVRPRTRAGANAAGARRFVEVLLAGKLEAMLLESEDGLSAITISKRSNAGYNQVLNLLRELEGSGQVRRFGTRRTSRWRVVTDEERIAERAAELEALSAARSPAPAGE
jgi:hypothetical protein